MEELRPRSSVLRQAIEQSKEWKPAPDAMLTVAEACQYLRISKWKLYQLMQDRMLSSVKLGRRRLIRMQSILKFVEQLEADTEI